MSTLPTKLILEIHAKAVQDYCGPGGADYYMEMLEKSAPIFEAKYKTLLENRSYTETRDPEYTCLEDMFIRHYSNVSRYDVVMAHCETVDLESRSKKAWETCFVKIYDSYC